MGRQAFVVFAAFGLAIPQVAAAQDDAGSGYNIDTFDVSGGMFDRQGTLQLAHPHLGMRGSWYAGLGAGYSLNPLVYEEQVEGQTEPTVTPIVKSQISTHVVGGYNLAGIARLDLDVPLYPVASTPAGSSFAMGDIRLGATLPLVKYEDDGFGLALVPQIVFPTGDEQAFVGASGFGGGVSAAAGVQAGIFGLVANVGVDLTKSAGVGQINTKDETAADGYTTSYMYTVGTAIPYGLGMHLNVAEPFLVGLELDGTYNLAGGIQAYNVSPLEAHVYGTYGTGAGFHGTLGVGTGVIAGIGAPDVRVFLGLSWRDPGAPPDADGDGLVDDEDSCPLKPEDMDNFDDADGCPDPNNDGDGLLDVDDRCPNNPEDADGFEDTDGCPDPDNDQDGLADGEDRCPIDPGPASTMGCPDRDSDGLADGDDECPDQGGPIETNGCPDSDNDHVPDIRDACPSEPADARIDPRRSNGCPSRVVVTKQSIEILEMVYFETNKAIIKPVSYGLLDDVATTLNTYADIKLIEVSGHTDDVGKDDANLKLSQARSEAVMKYLVTKGVDPTRLVARGYGETRPIDSNDTAAGRAKNRRVAFTILQQ